MEPMSPKNNSTTADRFHPGAAARRIPRSSHPAVSAFPGRGRRVGLHIDLFEACSAFTRVAAFTLARSPIRDPLSEGFRHFVASMPAPVASGWSESPGGPRTHWKAPPCTAHPHSSHCREPAQTSHFGNLLRELPSRGLGISLFEIIVPAKHMIRGARRPDTTEGE